MRGKPFHTEYLAEYERITPAHAGKTVYEGKPTLATRDHPRACGENSIPVLSMVLREGSPPRMRGKLKTCLFFFGRVGITPAHAGKTMLLYSLQ